MELDDSYEPLEEYQSRRLLEHSKLIEDWPGGIAVYYWDYEEDSTVYEFFYDSYTASWHARIHQLTTVGDFCGPDYKLVQDLKYF